eukprot:SAG11_NODE_6769_length_1251_cov_6.883681_1_plen_84_part_00
MLSMLSVDPVGFSIVVPLVEFVYRYLFLLGYTYTIVFFKLVSTHRCRLLRVFGSGCTGTGSLEIVEFLQITVDLNHKAEYSPE